MASESYHKNLIHSTKNPKTTTQKVLLFTLSIVTIISLAYLGSVSINSFNHFNSSKTLSLCHNSNDLTSCLAHMINEAITPSEIETTSFHSDDGRKMLRKILLEHSSDINKVIHVTKRSNNNDVHVKGTQEIRDCLDLMDLSRDRVFDSMKLLANNNNKNNDNKIDINIRTWLSAVLTNHVTCLDQLQNESHLLGLKREVEGLILNGRELLAVHAKFCGTNLGDLNDGGDNVGKKIRNNGPKYPSWVKSSDRKLLEVHQGSNVVADIVVAKDGSGNFTTVGEALAFAPDKGKKRYVIYVKEGVYEENVEVGKKKTNVMLVGAGGKFTILTGSENVVDGNTTFKSATLAAVGDGFILQDICIQNTAGPEKHQAVALRVGADKSVINRCKIDAYQDTLYTHSLRQFYTNSYITGTVDFIFGNAAVVFQNCQLVARKPLPGQKNMFTAQGRTDPNQNTGTSIQYCNILASPDLEPELAKFPTFLGRPWKEFSRTVVLQSNVDDLIDPTGWFPWDGDFALDTLYYAEYNNFGLGSDTSKRVNWTGYRVLTDALEAKQFTVGQFLQGQDWLADAGVKFIEGL